MKFVKLNQNGFVIERGFGPVVPEGFVEDNGTYQDDPNEMPEWVLVSSIKSQRNLLLQQSDWTQLPDVPIDSKQAWAAYRQQLRDVTSQSGYPFNVIWPTPPQG